MDNINKPLVSVFMITYGHAQVIARAIKGVLMQRGDFDLELIIADDCSPDDTEAVVKACLAECMASGLKREQDQVIYHRHKHNKGMAANALWTLDACQGDYIAFCEGDDEWIEPGKIEFQLDLLRTTGAIITFHDAMVFEEGEQYLYSSRFPCAEKVLFNELIYHVQPASASFFFRNIPLNDSFRQLVLQSKAIDRMCVLYLLNQGFGVYSSKVMANYHVLSTGAVKTFHRGTWIKNLIFSYELLKKIVKREHELDILKKQLDHKKTLVRHHLGFKQALEYKGQMIKDLYRLKRLPTFQEIKILLRLGSEKPNNG